MEEVRILTTLEEVRAISDPMKYRILASLNKLGGPATVKQIADSMKEVPAKVHYHVKKMEACGILAMVDTKEIKGIIAKYYEPTAKNFELKCDIDTIKSNKQLIKAEHQRLVSEMYDNSKNTLLEQTTNLYNQDDISSNRIGMFFMDELHLDEQELDEFRKCIKTFMDAHCDKKNKGPESKRYHMFISLFQLEN